MVSVVTLGLSSALIMVTLSSPCLLRGRGEGVSRAFMLPPGSRQPVYSIPLGNSLTSAGKRRFPR